MANQDFEFFQNQLDTIPPSVYFDDDTLSALKGEDVDGASETGIKNKFGKQ